MRMNLTLPSPVADWCIKNQGDKSVQSLIVALIKEKMQSAQTREPTNDNKAIPETR